MTICLNSCKHEPLEAPFDNTESDLFQDYNSTSLNKDFFYIGSNKRNGLGLNTTYHPNLLSAYENLKDQASSGDTDIENLSSTLGFPNWEQSETVITENGTNITMIPMMFPNQEKLSGILTVHRKAENGNFVHNWGAYSKSYLTDSDGGNSIVKLPYLRYVERVETRIFGKVDRDVIIILENWEDPPILADPLDDFIQPCEWKWIEVCHDWSSGIRWIGGVLNAPIHLDHDQDGVLNEIDQDFIDFMEFTGLDAEGFKDWIEYQWEINYQDQFGDYADFWNDYYDQLGDQYDQFDYDSQQDFDLADAIADAFEQAFGDIGDFFEGVWDAIQDAWGDIFGDGVPCPSFSTDCLMGSASSNRSFDCETYYYLDCGQNTDWWEEISNSQMCYVCPDLDNLPSGWSWFNRLREHYDNQINGQYYNVLDISFEQLEEMVRYAGCDHESSDFDDCILENVYKHLLNEIQSELLEFPISYHDSEWLLENPAKIFYLWNYYQNYSLQHETIVEPYLYARNRNLIDMLRLNVDVTNCFGNDFGECLIHELVVNIEGIADAIGCNNCNSGDWHRYVRCSDIVFSPTYQPGNSKYSHHEITGAILTFPCIPALDGAEGIADLVWLDLKVEIRLPAYLFDNVFGYAQQQTNVATFYTDAILWAFETSTIPLECGTAISRAQNLSDLFFDYLNTYDSKFEIWGSDASSIIVKRNFQTNTPNYEPTKGMLSMFPNVQNCN